MKRLRIIALALTLSLAARPAQAMPEWLNTAFRFMKQNTWAQFVLGGATMLGAVLGGTWVYTWVQEKKEMAERKEKAKQRKMAEQQEKARQEKETLEKQKPYFTQDLTDIDKDFTQELAKIKTDGMSTTKDNPFLKNQNLSYQHFNNDTISNYFFVNLHQNTKTKDLSYWANYSLRDLLNAFPFNNSQQQPEAITGMAYQYKIHLQIKPKYIVEVAKKLLDFITTDETGKDISEIKVVRKFEKGNTVPQDNTSPLYQPMPTIVIYLPFLPWGKKENNEFIAKILNTLTRYFKKEFGQTYNQLRLEGIDPRYNLHIHDFIYLAQGEGPFKYYIQEDHNKRSTNPLDLFTPDYAFFKGYEFDMSLIDKQ